MRKAITAQDYLFEWSAPTPINGTPSITIKASSTVTSVMSQSRVNATVSAIQNDRRTLTVDVQAQPLEGDQVRAFLKTAGDSFFAVKVVRMVGTVAILAEPLPREIDLSTSASLEFALWTYTAPLATVTSVSGTYPYEISYDSDLGSDDIKRLEKGVIKVTPRPFNTGLDHDELVATMPALADKIPRRQDSFAPQIKAALDEIALVIRDHVIPQDATEDEVFNVDAFKSAHAYCTAARIYEASLQLDVASSMRDRCDELMHLALRSVALDLDGDGVVDSGELDLRETGGSSRDLRASWSAYNKTDYDKTFIPVRAMRH